MRTALTAILTAVLLATAARPANQTRLKELVTIEGARDNQLMGYGLVVGLAGTGDRQQSIFPAQSLANLLERMGLTVNASAIQVKNTAAVMVTGVLPPYAQSGSHLDITISAMADAKSLQGGVLLMTNLHAADGQTYAVAQGPLVLGGFAVSGANGTSSSQNHPTVGRIPNGAIIERNAPSLNVGKSVRLQLERADFATATRVVAVLNKHFGDIAHAENAGLVTVSLPDSYQARATEFVAELEALTVETDRTAAIVVNERTGTIIMGKDVQIAPVAIMQGNLNVEIQTTANVSQPAPLSQGTTQVTQQSTVNAKQEPSRNLILKEGATVEELVRALTSIGSTPRDIISILQNLKDAGALEAELKVI